jgi:hypothetical protein
MVLSCLQLDPLESALLCNFKEEPLDSNPGPNCVVDLIRLSKRTMEQFGAPADDLRQFRLRAAK